MSVSYLVVEIEYLQTELCSTTVPAVEQYCSAAVLHGLNLTWPAVMQFGQYWCPSICSLSAEHDNTIYLNTYKPYAEINRPSK